MSCVANGLLRWDKVAFFTFLLTIVTGISVWSFIQSERGSAYPLGISLIPDGRVTEGNIIAFKIKVRSGGKEAVQIIGGNAGMANPRKPLPADPLYDSGEQSWQMILLPGDFAYLTSIPTQQGAKMSFGPTDIPDINAGRLNIWLYGYITYRDRFSVLLGPTTVGYCFHYNPDNDPALGMFDACGSAKYVYIH